MSRIDVQTLVLAFEKRIEALEKNPPDKVPTSVIMNMLEKSIDEIIKEHFVHLVKKEIQVLIKKTYKEMREEFISKTVRNMLEDEDFRHVLEIKFKNLMINSIK